MRPILSLRILCFHIQIKFHTNSQYVKNIFKIKKALKSPMAVHQPKNIPTTIPTLLEIFKNETNANLCWKQCPDVRSSVVWVERQEKLTGHREPPKSSLFTLSDSHYLLSFTICESFGYAALKGKRQKKRCKFHFRDRKFWVCLFKLEPPPSQNAPKLGCHCITSLQ